MCIRIIWGFLLFLVPAMAMAAWTGIAAFVGKNDSDWVLSSTLYQADIDFYGLRIEEKTQADLRVGASAGQFDLRLLDPFNVNAAEKYNGKFISLYLRWPIKLTEQLKLHSRVNYQLNLGEKSVDTENIEINWNEFSVDLGVSVELGLLSLRPFVNFRSIDGDISLLAQTRLFKQSDSTSYGLMLDYFVERYAFVRLQASAGGQHVMMISFAREF